MLRGIGLAPASLDLPRYGRGHCLSPRHGVVLTSHNHVKIREQDEPACLEVVDRERERFLSRYPHGHLRPVERGWFKTWTREDRHGRFERAADFHVSDRLALDREIPVPNGCREIFLVDPIEVSTDRKTGWHARRRRVDLDILDLGQANDFRVELNS